MLRDGLLHLIFLTLLAAFLFLAGLMAFCVVSAIYTAVR